MIGRILAFVYGLIAYLAFFVTILYAIGFTGNLVVPKSVDTGTEGPMGQSIFINTLLLGLFAIQHTIMARPKFKDWWTNLIPKPIERSTFVLIASGILALAFWQWQPIQTIVWDIHQPAVRTVILGVFFLGWALLFYSSFVIDHFDLFGLRQVFFYLSGREYTHPPFKEKSVYRFVRHPLMTGMLIAFWAAPTMTQGHLLFSVLATGYILIGTMIEDRTLSQLLGEEYHRYRDRTPKFFPWFKKAG